MTLESEHLDSTESWNLIALTPKYEPTEHSGYVAALEKALTNEQIRNIALSGNFGLGKSSILRELGRRLDGRVVELSMSALAPIEPSKLDDSIPIQATTTTNRIQQEIVKQLLYREKPGKMPGSRFERIERFRWKRELSIAALAGLIIAVVFLLTGWSAQIAAVFTPLIDVGLWIHLIMLLTATAVVLGIRWLTYGRIHIKQFSAGAATVTLDDKSVSYFDQYLDEIVHFFEVSKKQDVVIFEDIDRFDDAHIFETLRSLNTLLNGAPQIKKNIRFIYAIKDSIFDKISLQEQERPLDRSILETDDPARAESVRANRTKFFDLVIPVVPFITHRSARDLAAELLSAIEHNIDPELLDLAAQYVPDMRLLKNVRNEFIVFRDCIFSGDGKHLDLSETDLFAMMLYKSTHLTDFEKIRLGTSNLDVLYKSSRDLVTQNIKRLEAERRELRQKIDRIDGIATRSTNLGERVLAHIHRTVQAVGYYQQGATYSVAGAAKTADDLKSAQFWVDFVSADGDPVLEWRNNYGHSLSFSRNHIADELGDPLDPEAWDESEREGLREEIAEKTETIEFLRSADMGALIRHPEFLVKDEKEDEAEAQSFDAIARSSLTAGLAYQLIREGFINRNFTLYTSTFHGNRVSPAAMNFIIHHVERDSMDVQFELTSEEVDMVVREQRPRALEEPALYNIAILDRLLELDPESADIMIHSLMSLGDLQRQFLQAYLDASHHRNALISRMTPMSAQLLNYLVSEVELDEPSRIELVDVALAHLISLKQRTDDAVGNYLRVHYAEFSALTSDATTPEQAERIAGLFADAGVNIPSLEPLGKHLRSSFVSRNLYAITHENLTLAIDNTGTIALDAIQRANPTVYGYVLGNLGPYLTVVDGMSATIVGNREFVGVMEDVLDHEKDHLDDVVAGSSPGCVVDDLSVVAEGAWPTLAQHLRFPATFSNVSLYVTALDVDASLSVVLEDAGGISNVSPALETSKVYLARSILAAKDVLPSPSLRSTLVASLNLADPLQVETIPAEKGDLFALLLKHRIIADDADSYEYLAGTDWPTREAFIHTSTRFHSYMEVDHVRGEIVPLLLSRKVDNLVKETILSRADEFVEEADKDGFTQLAKFAISQKKSVSEDVLLLMASAGVPPQQVVILLKAHLSTIDKDQLFSVLQSLGGSYSQLTHVGYDKPKIPNTPANRALVERLKQYAIVSSYEEQESHIKVNKRRKK